MTFYRRNLPHWHPEGRAIFLTWRLFGSLPKDHTSSTAPAAGAPSPGCAGKGTDKSKSKSTGKSACATSAGAAFRKIDAELDRAISGPVWLRDPKIAVHAEDAILRGEKLGQYRLDAYVVMPNHVHVLQLPLVPLARITSGIKGVSARDANAALGRVGQPFWQDESYDHWVRNEAEFESIRQYIEYNPVMAGLVESPEDWPWSSAKRGSTATRGCAAKAKSTGKSAGAT